MHQSMHRERENEFDADSERDYQLIAIIGTDKSGFGYGEHAQKIVFFFLKEAANSSGPVYSSSIKGKFSSLSAIK